MKNRTYYPLLGSLPNKCYLACSGGVDSMFALSFLKQVPTREVTIAFFHHGTKTSSEALAFLTEKVKDKFNVNLTVAYINLKSNAGISQEEHWRNERYKFFHKLNAPVVMAHHLDDCVETWLFGAMHGQTKTIPYSNGNVIRPFLRFRKKFIVDWCKRRNILWSEDKSNEDLKYMRNLIRHKIVPEALKVNPGLHKVVDRKVVMAYDER